MTCAIITKYPGENKVITLDYSQFDEVLNDGETIASLSTVTVSPTGLTLSTQSTTSTTGSVLVTGGTADISYKVFLLANTSGSHKIGDYITVDVLS